MTFSTRGLNRLLNKYGVEVSLVSKTKGSYDVSLGEWVQESAPSSVIGYFYNYEDDAVDGSNIQNGDSKLALKSTEINGEALPKPMSGDLIKYGSDTWSVVGCQTIRSKASVICYLVQVRN